MRRAHDEDIVEIKEHLNFGALLLDLELNRLKEFVHQVRREGPSEREAIKLIALTVDNKTEVLGEIF